MAANAGKRDHGSSSHFAGRPMVFSPIKTTRVADGVFKQIRASIERGDIKVGEKLPSERALAEQFNVNRAGVREALRVLEAVGVVEVRHGLGCYAVSDTVTQEAPSIWVPWLTVHRDDVLALLEVRESLEVKAARLAAIKRTNGELMALERVVAEMRALAVDPQVTPGELSELDVQFHESIAHASKNKFLVELLRQSGNALETDRYAIFAVRDRPVRSVEEHQAILDGIQSGDPDRAADAMVRHVELIRETIETLKMAETTKRD